MAAKANLGGITPQRFDQYDYTPGTGAVRTNNSASQEAAKSQARRGRKTYASPTPNSNSQMSKIAGTKVAGATSTSGGAL